MTTADLKPTPEQANDGLAIVLFLVLLGFTTPTLFSYSPEYGVIATFGPMIAYIVSTIILPIMTSKPLEHSEISESLEGNYQLRITESGQSRAIDVWLWRGIILSETDVNGYYKDWRSVANHELAHLLHRDARFFHVVGITGTIFVAQAVVLISAIILNISTESYAGSIFTATILALAVLFFSFWIRQGLHIREFRADSFAAQRNYEATQDWIRRAERHESHEENGSWTILGPIINWLTHPTFKRRKAALSPGPFKNPIPIRSEILRSLTFFYVGPALGYFVFSAIQFMPPIPLPATIAFPSLYTHVLLPVGASCAAISVATMLVWDRWNAFRSLLFCISVGIISWSILLLFTRAVEFLGLLDDLAAGLPTPPDGEVKDGALLFLFILLNFSIVLFFQNCFIRLLLRRRRYSILAHMLASAFTLIGAFLLTKLQYPYIAFIVG